MKKLILLTALLITVFFSYAQFGGGTGTETDPYQIWNKANWDELSDSFNIWLSDSTYNTCSDSTGFEGVHFRLMADIDEEVDKAILVAYKYDTISWNSYEVYFNGFFHGAGHHINVKTSELYQNNERSLFFSIGPTGYLDSLEIIGNPTNFGAMVYTNFGTIYACTSNLSITSAEIINPSPWMAGICMGNSSSGKIISCVNKMNLTLQVGGGIGGVCNSNYGEIRNCKNLGNLYLKHGTIGGISHSNSGLIVNCINYGNLASGEADNPGLAGFGGICSSIINENAAVRNCINIGNVTSSVVETGGISGFLSNGGIAVENCSNFGKITCTYTDNAGIVASWDNHIFIRNNLNVAKTSGSAIGTTNTFNTSNNYYDKQMCLSNGIDGADVIGSAEGRLTIQLVGNSPALQSMLGNGWSYAVGRYPIPLGLENDSLALVAATPVYLYADNETSYNHVDSVNRNFTVGLENNVSWAGANGRVNFNGENVTLLNIGMETITVNLGEFSKKVRINILDTETSTIQETITENGIIIYPNPASDYINLNLNGISADEIELCDITGKILSSQFIASEHNQTHIGNLKPGMYLLKIYNKNQNVKTLRFVKN